MYMVLKSAGFIDIRWTSNVINCGDSNTFLDIRLNIMAS